MRWIERVVVPALVLAFVGCRHTPKDSFRVQVVTSDGKPVSGATLTVGFDWLYVETTDDAGFVYVPKSYKGDTATITKTNFRSLHAEVTPDARITLSPMPESLQRIGEVEGDAILFGPETLVTIGLDDRYRVYAYTDTRITEIASLQLSRPVRMPKVYGDMLWYATYDSGLYVYSLSDRLHPAQVMHIDIGGGIDGFAVTDTFIAADSVGGPLRIFSYSSDGSTRYVSLVDSIGSWELAMISHYLVVGPMPVVFDIADIRNPREIYSDTWPRWWSGFIDDDRIIACGYDTIAGRDTSCFGVVDLADPSKPGKTGPFPTDTWLADILNDSLAVGNYSLQGISIARGSIAEGFHSVAIVQADAGFHGYTFQGCRHPYYALYGGLWKLANSADSQ